MKVGITLHPPFVRDSQCHVWLDWEEKQCESAVKKSPLPHDFTDPRYLFRALDVYCEKTGNGYTLQRFLDPADGVLAVIYAGPLHDWTGRAQHGDSIKAFRNAFHATLMGGAK